MRLAAMPSQDIVSMSTAFISRTANMTSETELLFSYASLLPQSSVDYSCPNLHGMRYYLDATLSSPKLFQTSTGIQSGPIAFLFYIPVSATSTSLLIAGVKPPFGTPFV